MICFEVRLNGKVLCTAGVGDLGGLTALLTWVKRNPINCPDGLNIADWSEEELNLTIGGTIGQGQQGTEFLDWIRLQVVSVGDEISIRILNQEHGDPPAAKRVWREKRKGR